MIEGVFTFLEPDGSERFSVTNHWTNYGMQKVVGAAFQGLAVPAQVGLCTVNPSDVVLMTELNEPTLGGYARQDLTFNSGNWPTLGIVNGYITLESRTVTFPTPGPNYNVAVSRLFLTDGLYVMSVSAPIPNAPQIFGVANPAALKYTLFFK